MLLAELLRGWCWQESPNLTQECRCIDRSLSDTPSGQFGISRVALLLMFGQSVYILQDLFRLLFILLFEFLQSFFMHIERIDVNTIFGCVSHCWDTAGQGEVQKKAPWVLRGHVRREYCARGR